MNFPFRSKNFGCHILFIYLICIHPSRGYETQKIKIGCLFWGYFYGYYSLMEGGNAQTKNSGGIHVDFKTFSTNFPRDFQQLSMSWWHQ